MAKPKKSGKPPSQKQKQTQIVNINLGTKAKKKGKSKPRKKEDVMKQQNVSILPAPIINYPPQFVAPNNPNWFTPPPVSQSIKQYAVLPEGETAGALNLNPVVPVPLKIERAEERLNAPIPEPRLEQLVEPPVVNEEPFIEDDISVLSEAPQFLNLPEETAGQVLDLPPAEITSLIDNKEPLFDPFRVDLPTSSGRSLAESIAEPPSEEGFSYQFSVGEEGYEERLPQTRFLGTLPPIKTAEKSELPFSPLPSSGLTLPPPLLKKPKPFLGETPPPVVEAPKKGRPTGAKNKPKKEEEPKSNLFSVFPTQANVEPLSIPIQIGQREEDPFKFSPPLSQLEGQYEFIGQPKQPTEKETNPLERRRGGGVLTGAEEAVIGGTPAFLTGR
jgi:hypothetical protein